MNSYHEMINRVTEMICEHIDDTENFILIGDNSSGKSEILRTIIERKKGEAVYYIDSVNRTFDAGKVELFSEKYKEIKPDFQVQRKKCINLYSLKNSLTQTPQ